MVRFPNSAARKRLATDPCKPPKELQNKCLNLHPTNYGKLLPTKTRKREGLSLFAARLQNLPELATKIEFRIPPHRQFDFYVFTKEQFLPPQFKLTNWSKNKYIFSKSNGWDKRRRRTVRTPPKFSKFCRSIFRPLDYLVVWPFRRRAGSNFTEAVALPFLRFWLKLLLFVFRFCCSDSVEMISLRQPLAIVDAFNFLFKLAAHIQPWTFCFGNHCRLLMPLFPFQISNSNSARNVLLRRSL